MGLTEVAMRLTGGRRDGWWVAMQVGPEILLCLLSAQPRKQPGAPGFEAVGLGLDHRQRLPTAEHLISLADFHCALWREVEEEGDATMDASDGGRVVEDYSDGGEGSRGKGDGHLFPQFALEARPERRGAILGVEMAADADGFFAVEAGFALFRQSGDREDFRTASQADVGNDLQMGLIEFGLAAEHEEAFSIDEREDWGEIGDPEGCNRATEPIKQPKSGDDPDFLGFLARFFHFDLTFLNAA